MLPSKLAMHDDGDAGVVHPVAHQHRDEVDQRRLVDRRQRVRAQPADDDEVDEVEEAVEKHPQHEGDAEGDETNQQPATVEVAGQACFTHRPGQ